MEMDTRLQRISYSSLLTFHSCPRKFQLYKLNSKINEDDDIGQSVTFAFGHVVGLGIQEYITHHDINQTYWKCFLEWDCDLLAENTKQAKSFWLAMLAVEKFISMCDIGYMKDWSLCMYQGKPATELSFEIQLDAGFTYSGFVDAVLQHNETGEVMVLECKTTSAYAVNAAAYKNSFQAIGYSIVLDALFPTLSSYQVQYLIYKTKSKEYESMIFDKSYLDRALWIRSLLLDIDTIKMYNAVGVYPMHGESCNDFYRECEYFGLCTLSTDKITSNENEKEKKKEYAITLHINDLITSQLNKS